MQLGACRARTRAATAIGNTFFTAAYRASTLRYGETDQRGQHHVGRRKVITSISLSRVLCWLALCPAHLRALSSHHPNLCTYPFKHTHTPARRACRDSPRPKTLAGPPLPFLPNSFFHRKEHHSRRQLLHLTSGKLGRSDRRKTGIAWCARNPDALKDFLHRFRRPVLFPPRGTFAPLQQHFPITAQFLLSWACSCTWLPRAPSLHLDYPQSIG